MKPNLHVGVPVRCFSRKLFLVEVAVTLSIVPLTVGGAGNTNFATSDFRSISANAVAPARVVPVTGVRGVNLESVAASQLAFPSNQMTFGELDAGATFPVARELMATPSLSAQTDSDFASGAPEFVLTEPAPTAMRQRAGEAAKSPVVRFFVPSVSVSSPQGGRNAVLDESERPWAVISAGVATGKSWHDPDTYRAHRYLGLDW
jgi:hypothetical protein